MKDPLELIADERKRKGELYGYDDKAVIDRTEDYGNGELADAAASYALAFRDDTGKPCIFWPWGREYFKATPDDRIKELVKAGAFIVDEIVRLQNLEDVA